MELFSNLALGFSTASTLANLGFCLIGVLLGTLIGVLPGIGATATIAMLLPVTFQIGDPVSAMIMLAGIYYGAQYGGSTTAILINMPGESSSAVTAIDGYQMARRGRAGAALAIAAIGSFFAGTVSTFLVAVFAPPLTEIALKFGSAEYFSLMVVGLVSSVALAHGSIVKALAMVVLGLLLGLVGTDIYTGPESANNAGAQTSFIPMLTLGIPANPVMALMIGAMIIQGIVPGPNVATEQPALFWGVIASMWIGNLMLIVLNLPLIGLWVKLLTVPYYVLFPIIMTFCSIGVYSVNSNVYDLYAVAFFGFIGYLLAKLRCEPAPLLLGFVLGPLLEEHLRRAMILSRGDPATFFTRPISAILLAIAAAVLVVVLLPSVRKKRDEVFVEEG